MQCTNCQFHNMPGSAVCGRCGTSLVLATTAIDVHPPRASGFSKKLRKLKPAARTYYEARDAFDGASSRSIWLFGQLTPSLPPPPITLRLILPGWSQIYVGRRLVGFLFLWSYLVLLLMGLLFFGHIWGSVLLGLAFSIHSTAAVDILASALAPGEVRRRMVRGLFVTGALAFFLYWPLGRLLTSVADPQVIDTAVLPYLHEHDVLLVNHWTSPHVGQIVLYELPEFRDGYADMAHHGYIIYGGERIDRILAGPGDVVRCDDGRLTINNVLSEWLPLNPIQTTGKISINVPEGCYFIVPSTTVGARGRADPGLWSNLGIIPFANIHGSAYLRSNPLSRWARLR